MSFYTRKTRPADKFTTAEVAFLITFADGGGGGGGSAATWFSESTGGGGITGAVNGTNKTFTLTRTPFLNSLQLVLNDAYLIPGALNDYTLSTATITVATAPPTGSVLYALYQ